MDERSVRDSPLHILFLEDNPADFALILAVLEKEGIRCEPTKVETRADFTAALSSRPFDLILSDCSLPSFDGFSALQITREANAARAPGVPPTPFIFVSGTVGEELVIETLKSGATDYVLKQRLSRLVPAVRRALAETRQWEARDAAERNRAEAESLFRSLFDQLTIGVAIASLNGRIIEANPALAVMLGYCAAELSDIPVADLAFPEDSMSGLDEFEDLFSGKRTSYELQRRLLRRDGTPFWANTVVSLIRESGGLPRFSIHLIEDITSRKEIEQRFIQAQKMEVVGRLAAGFAHDFNNVLTLINGYSQRLLEEIPQNDPARRELREIRMAGQRATTLTKRLLTFSRQNVQPPNRLLDLNAIILALEDMLRHLIGDGVRLTIQLGSEAASIEQDQTQIEQILMNLAINARDAMPGGGDLRITTTCVQVDAVASAAQAIAPGEYVVLEVADTGHGMDESTRARIFEPFFTTKEVGKGTGLGLWMAWEIVQQSRGCIIVDSELERGTSFRIYLPRAASPVVALVPAAAPQGNACSRSGSETILVIESDVTLRKLAEEILEPAGYHVLLARHNREAASVMERHAGQIQLLIADADKPHIHAIELASQPEMRILHIRGYSSAEPTANSAPPRYPCLQEPYTAEALLASVREILDTPVGVSIAVVDDDPAIRGFLRDVLGRCGYRIIEASNGRQAVQQLYREPVDLLITDLIMPDQDGLETIIKVTKEFPNLRVVAMSGGSGEQFLSVAAIFGAVEVLCKPFEADEIRTVVRRVLKDRTSKKDLPANSAV